jgi:hypothetical protein
MTREPRALVLVEVHQQLGVTASAQLVPPRAQLGAQRLGAIEFAVEHGAHRPALVPEGLRAARNVHHGQPRVAQRHVARWAQPVLPPIGPALTQGLERLLHHALLDGRQRIEQRDQAAHAAPAQANMGFCTWSLTSPTSAESPVSSAPKSSNECSAPSHGDTSRPASASRSAASANGA